MEHWQINTSWDEEALTSRSFSSSVMGCEKMSTDRQLCKQKNKRCVQETDQTSWWKVFHSMQVFTWAWESLCTAASPLWWWQPQTWGSRCCWCQRSSRHASSWWAAAFGGTARGFNMESLYNTNTSTHWTYEVFTEVLFTAGRAESLLKNSCFKLDKSPLNVYFWKMTGFRCNKLKDSSIIRNTLVW